MLMSWLGHRDGEMTRHYYHMQPDEARRQMGKFPALGSPVDESPADQEGQGRT